MEWIREKVLLLVKEFNILNSPVQSNGSLKSNIISLWEHISLSVLITASGLQGE